MWSIQVLIGYFIFLNVLNPYQHSKRNAFALAFLGDKKIFFGADSFGGKSKQILWGANQLPPDPHKHLASADAVNSIVSRPLTEWPVEFHNQDNCTGCVVGVCLC